MTTNTTSHDLKSFKRNIFIFSFCEGLIFWYAIEKLFMQSIGLSLEVIVVIGIIAQAGKMIFEIPSSVLADRWNRRNTLALGTLAMILVSLILPFATTPLNYTIFVLLWTIYFAFKSGTDTAFIYDSLKNLGQEKAFQSILARYRSVELAGLIISSMAAGIIASVSNLQIPFWITVVPLVIGLVALLRLKEPPINRDGQKDSKFWQHAVLAWRDIRKKSLVWAVALYAVLFALIFIWYEYYQVYGLAVDTPAVLFGSLLAVLCVGQIVGSEIVHKLTITKKVVAVAWITVFVAHIGGLLVGTFISFLGVIFATMVALQILYLSLTDAINHRIDSSRRATILSLGGSASQFIFLVLALVFRFVIEHWGVQAAFLAASLPLIVLGAIDILRRVAWLQNTKITKSQSLAQAEIANQESMH